MDSGFPRNDAFSVSVVGLAESRGQSTLAWYGFHGGGRKWVVSISLN